MTDLVIMKEQQAVTSSLQVAEVFGKEHRHVLRAIDEVKEGVAQNWADLFYEDTYTHPQNKQEYRLIYMNRDGFTLLAMGFTGKKALQFKLQYIEAFNKMEAHIKQSLQPESSLEAAVRTVITNIKQAVIEEVVSNGYEQIRDGVLADVRNELTVMTEAAFTVNAISEPKYSTMTSSKLAQHLGFTGKGRIAGRQLNKALATAGILEASSDDYGRKCWKVTPHWLKQGIAVERTYVGGRNWFYFTPKGVQKIVEMAAIGVIAVQ